MTGGLYVHFPYCEHHCSYCDFVVATPRHIPQARFTDAILAELSQRAPAFDRPAETLYLGGGTPSLWDPRELDRLLHAVHDTPGLIDGAEITLEANPNEITAERMATLMALGITRISLGVQSFQDDLLAAIDRRHGGAQAREACELIARAQFDSHSIDLIFGLPGQDTKRWDDDLSIAIAMAPPHLSVYGLTVEPKTVFDFMRRRQTLDVPSDDGQADMYAEAIDVASSAGYEHYEISNFAREGHRSRHNWDCWTGGEYIGVGVSAHSYLDGRRFWNGTGLDDYIKRVHEGDSPQLGEERLSPTAARGEALWLGLRTCEGVCLSVRERECLVESDLWRRLQAVGHARLEGKRLWLTEAGFAVADAVSMSVVDVVVEDADVIDTDVVPAGAQKA